MLALYGGLLINFPDDTYRLLGKEHLNYKTGFIYMSQSWFVVSITGCEQAKMALAHHPEKIDESVYEVVIGAQSKKAIEIRDGRGGTILAEHVGSEDLLDCSQYK